MGTVIVLFEQSRQVAGAFERRGWRAISVDLREAGAPGEHVVDDVYGFVRRGGLEVADLVVAHPVCTFLTVSGLHWNNRVHGRHASTLRALHQTRELFNALDGWTAGGRKRAYCVENPVGIIGTHIEPPHAHPQTVQPFNFGEDASKATVLWRRNLPKLRATGRAQPRYYDDGRAQLGLFGTGVERWSNQTDSGQNALGPSEDRWSERSETYPGIADAMAQQWGDFLLS